MKEKNIGTSSDSWLDEEGIRQEVAAGAIKRVLARQVAATMTKDGLTKTAMARRMRTSRATLDRLLDAEIPCQHCRKPPRLWDVRCVWISYRRSFKNLHRMYLLRSLSFAIGCFVFNMVFIYPAFP